MKITLQVTLGVVLGWAAIQGIESVYRPSANSPPANPSGIVFDRAVVICDRAHTTFDASGNTYCMDDSRIKTATVR